MKILKYPVPMPNSTEQTFCLTFQVENFDTKVCSCLTYIWKLKNKFRLHNVPEEKQILLLIDAIGLETFAKLEDLCQPTALEEKTFAELELLLSNYFEPAPNTYSERYQFYKRVQQEESVSEYAADLKKLTKHCKFPSIWLQEALITQLIVGIKDGELRVKLMQELFATFEKAIEFANTYVIAKEAATNTAALAKSQEELVLVKKTEFQQFQQYKKGKQDTKKDRGKLDNSNNVRSKCNHCSRTNHKSDICYHRENTCHVCQTKGHIATICKNKQENYSKLNVNKNETKTCNVEYDSDNSIDMFKISSNIDDKILMPIEVNGINIQMEFDPGAGAAIISQKLYNAQFSSYLLRPSNIILASVFKESKRPIGCFECSIKFQDKEAGNVSLLVVEDEVESIIGRSWLRALRIIDNRNNVYLNMNKLEIIPIRSKLKDILQKYKSLFDGEIGRAKEYKALLQIRKNEKPIYLKARPVPLAIKPLVTETLLDLEKKGILERTMVSEWGTPIVPSFQKGKLLRICGDFKSTVNKKLCEDKYPIPHKEEICAKLNGGKYFCKLDIHRVYLHISVDDKSAELQTISTHLGNFKVKRLFFGIKTAPSIFQRYIDQLLGHLEGVSVFFDDIKIQGKN